FVQAEDGIRDFHVTGVQTCALPISDRQANGVDGEALPRLVRVGLRGRVQNVLRRRRGRLRAGSAVRGRCRRGGTGRSGWGDRVRSEERRVGKKWKTEWNVGQDGMIR